MTNKPVQQYEYISAFSKNGDVEYNDQEYMWLSAYAGHAYRFVKRLTKEERKNWGYAGIWEMNTVRANKDHPAMYPVELPWRCIKMHSDRGDIVLEPFSGSGTTIIACEQLERVCYAMEKSPGILRPRRQALGAVHRPEGREDHQPCRRRITATPYQTCIRCNPFRWRSRCG